MIPFDNDRLADSPTVYSPEPQPEEPETVEEGTAVFYSFGDGVLVDFFPAVEDEDEDGYFFYPYVDNGSLIVVGDDGETVAMYAPGVWLSYLATADNPYGD